MDFLAESYQSAQCPFGRLTFFESSPIGLDTRAKRHVYMYELIKGMVTLTKFVVFGNIMARKANYVLGELVGEYPWGGKGLVNRQRSNVTFNPSLLCCLTVGCGNIADYRADYECRGNVGHLSYVMQDLSRKGNLLLIRRR